jgi:predicted O-linked N-acetylglucosamine transferase (SPINDLY family)
MSDSLQDMLRSAVELHQQMKLDDAELLYTQVLAADPSHADALQLLGALNLQRGRAGDAVELIERALTLSPNKAPAHLNLANALVALGRREEALDSFARAITLRPENANAYYDRGGLLSAVGRHDEALADYDDALRLKPAWAEAFLNRGNVLKAMGRHGEALVSYEQAVKIRSDFPEAFNNAASVLEAAGRSEQALENYRRAVALNPRYAEAFCNLGGLLGRLKRHAEAFDAYSKAMDLRPDLDGLANAWLHARQILCAWRGTDTESTNFIACIVRGELICTPFELIATPASPATQLQTAAAYGTRHYPQVAPLWSGERYDHDKIRIGYFSADFRNHATAYLMTGMLEQHDRTKFEITGFSWGASKPNDAKARIEAAFDRVIQVHGQSDRDVAALAQSLEIDIAVDLKGFTQDARTGIFAQRPAPVQVNYLGYPGTMGVPYIDYLIADPVLIPADQRAHYSEHIAYLPDTYQVNDTKRPIAPEVPSRRALGLPATGFVFCSFNHNWKLSPAVFEIWMRLLHAVPGSVLWLIEGLADAKENLCREAEARGISADRLVFAPQLPLAQHLARHAHVDVFLDTFYCNGHTTTSDALWAGVPVVTWASETFAGRVSASLLTAAGLSELITTTWTDYEALALALAADPKRRAVLRAKLAADRGTCALFDTVRFTRNIETAYVRMWERAQQGLPPADIIVAQSHLMK